MSAEDQARTLRNEVAVLHGVVAALDGHVGRLIEVAEKVYEVAAAQIELAKRTAEVEEKLEKRLAWPTRFAFLWAGGSTAVITGYVVLKALGLAHLP